MKKQKGERAGEQENKRAKSERTKERTIKKAKLQGSERVIVIEKLSRKEQDNNGEKVRDYKL